MGPQFFVDGGFVCTYKGITRLLGRGSVRITPAHAGKSMRGECCQYWDLGSPPHTRGKVCFLFKGLVINGITPAHAGKRNPRWHGCWRSGDHPRTRGEKKNRNLLGHRKVGSPPHTRGKVLLLEALAPTPRITPAHAGKSLYPWRLASAFRDHPRTRGEKQVAVPWMEPPMGSPPHTRGKAISAPILIFFPGITPAHAGKSGRQDGQHREAWDHPRTRGEKRCTLAEYWKLQGSPPHTRGKVEIGFHGVGIDGITPAHAGKRGPAQLAVVHSQDHPRTRGEKEDEPKTDAPEEGSPPHTRGKD